MYKIGRRPFLVRWLEITNKSDAPVGIYSVSPLSGRIWTRSSKRYADPLTVAEAIGDCASGPFSLAYNHMTHWGAEGDFYFEPLGNGEARFDGGSLWEIRMVAPGVLA